MSRRSYRVKFPSSAGLQLAGIVDRPDDDDPHPVLIFSHCFTCNKDLKSTVRISRAMAELGIAVLRFDMTGLGGSEGDFSTTSFTSNLADLRSAIAFASGDIGSVTGLMGHSFGGAASLAIASDPPPDTSLGAVITLAAPSDTTHLAQLLAKMNPAIEADGVGQVVIGGFKYMIRREMLDDFRSHDLPKMISRIRVPALLLHSPDDETVGYEQALRIMSLLQASPDLSDGTASASDVPASLLSLHGGDHLVSDQRDIEYVAGAVASFLHRYAG